MIASVDRILAEARAEEALEAWEEFDRHIRLALMSVPNPCNSETRYNLLLKLLPVLNVARSEIKAAKAALGMETAPRFEVTYCSQCGGTFGPGDHGFSHCENHSEIARLF